MRKISTLISFCFLLHFCPVSLQAQVADSAANTLPFSDKYIDAVADKAKKIQSSLDKKSEKALAQLKKQEDKLLKKLNKLDSNGAKQLMEPAKVRYAELEEKLKHLGKLTQYLPGLDSSSTALNFLDQNAQIKEIKDKLQSAIGKMDALKAQLQKAESIKQFLKERKEYIKTQLEKFGLVKNLKKLNKTVFYYQQQIAEYKNILNDPKKIEKKALDLLSKTKLWKDFFKKNSLLANFLRIPSDYDNNSTFSSASLSGLQARIQVNQLIQQQVAAGGPNASQQIQQNIQNAQVQMNQFKDKLNRFGASGDGDIPDFKPNNQKTKPFLKRLEYGFNIQTQKANNLFPTTSDLAAFGGFKIDDKKIIGIGASYKLGLGTGWNNIRLSHQGVGLRTYLDWKFKGSIWLSGGYEQNYKSIIRNISQLQNKSTWQKSGLIGLSKKYKVGNKLNGKVQLMWDFLSYQQIPRTQPLVFRIGFSFK